MSDSGRSSDDFLAWPEDIGSLASGGPDKGETPEGLSKLLADAHAKLNAAEQELLLLRVRVERLQAENERLVDEARERRPPSTLPRRVVDVTALADLRSALRAR